MNHVTKTCKKNKITPRFHGLSGHFSVAMSCTTKPLHQCLQIWHMLHQVQLQCQLSPWKDPTCTETQGLFNQPLWPCGLLLVQYQYGAVSASTSSTPRRSEKVLVGSERLKFWRAKKKHPPEGFFAFKRKPNHVSLQEMKFQKTNGTSKRGGFNCSSVI